MNKPRVLLAWSTGKDAAWTLHVLRQAGEVDVVGLLTTVNAASGDVAMHATHPGLLAAQARAVGLPLITASIPWPCSNVEYEAAFHRALNEAQSAFGITHIAFGDLYLADIRAYREAQLQGTGLTPLFPLWSRPTRALALEMLAGGLKAIVACVDPRRLPADFAGRAFDARLLADLPDGVDPCGEGGEFHTFAYHGPMFAHPVPCTTGETAERDGFVFTNILPEDISAEISGE